MRLAIVEDDRMLLENLKLLLSGEKSMTVVGSFSSGEEALQKMKETSPEVILTDLGLPGMPGVEFIKRAKAEMPEIEMMAFTVFEDRETIFSAIKAGASGYVLKGSTPRELIESLNTLYQGGAPMSPKIARAVIQEFQDEAASVQYLLTPKEKEVIKAIEKGFSYKEIGKNMCVSPHTVHAHIKKIYEKLQVKTRQEALIKARRQGII